MTPLETLQKYGLKTDVKSIKERVMYPSPIYFETAFKAFLDAKGVERHHVSELSNDLRAADLALLCELAEKGERYETPKPIKVVQGGCGGTWKKPLCPSCGKDIQSANDFSFMHCPHCGQKLNWKITESEGETK